MRKATGKVPRDEEEFINCDLWNPEETSSRYVMRQIQEMHAVEAWRALLPNKELQHKNGRMLGYHDARCALTN